MHWCEVVGINLATATYLKKHSLGILCPVPSCCLFFRFTFSPLTLFVRSDIHLNLMPKRNRSCYYFAIYHQNLNSATAYNYEKIKFEAYNTFTKFDMICISKSCQDSSILSNSEQLNIKGYKLVRNDHPGNVRRGVICAHFRESLPVRFISSPYLNECLIFEVFVNNKKSYLVSLYWSPSQVSDESKAFLVSLEKLFSIYFIFLVVTQNFCY